MNAQQRAVWEKAVEMLEENREYIEANERPAYLELYDKAIADANALLMRPEPEHDHALEQALTRLQKRYNELEAKVGAQPEQADEPVAWGNLANWCLDSDRVLITDKTKAENYHRDVYDLTPLYTRPQPAAWVGLTDDEVEFFRRVGHAPLNTTRAIEAKLREKNGGA